MMKKEYQVTLLCTNGKYRPVSTIIRYEQEDNADRTKEKEVRQELQFRGIQKICARRRWDKTDLIRGGYTKVKVRAYDKAKIDKENKERYNRIKEEKYASGEWKRPKGDK